jgi:hypothetical protein
LIRQLSFTAQGNLISLTAFMGGFFAQEVIKSISGKFLPLDQWVLSLTSTQFNSMILYPLQILSSHEIRILRFLIVLFGLD